MVRTKSLGDLIIERAERRGFKDYGFFGVAKNLGERHNTVTRRSKRRKRFL